MKHLAAYLLLGLGGNTSPSAKDIKVSYFEVVECARNLTIIKGRS